MMTGTDCCGTGVTAGADGRAFCFPAVAASGFVSGDCWAIVYLAAIDATRNSAPKAQAMENGLILLITRRRFAGADRSRCVHYNPPYISTHLVAFTFPPASQCGHRRSLYGKTGNACR